MEKRLSIVKSVNILKLRHLYCTIFKFGHQVATLALLTKLATRWRHLHQLEIWSPAGATCDLHYLHCFGLRYLVILMTMATMLIFWDLSMINPHLGEVIFDQCHIYILKASYAIQK